MLQLNPGMHGGICDCVPLSAAPPRHREHGGAPLVWQRGAEEEMAGAAAEGRNSLLLLHDW